MWQQTIFRNMKRFGQTFGVFLLLVSIFGLSVASDVYAGSITLSPSCTMVSGDSLHHAEDSNANGSGCHYCRICHACSHCFGTAIVVEASSVVAVRSAWHFDNYTPSFLSVIPSVDSPPPRRG
ncbi:MAG: hypothetical protein P8171_23080 [Candidatus Thiodiazotropha sp.]